MLHNKLTNYQKRIKTIKKIKIVIPSSLDLTYEKFLKIHLKNSKSCSYDIVTVGKSKSKLKKELIDADILIAINWSAKSPPAPKLKLIQIPAAGYDNINFSAIPKNCNLCNVNKKSSDALNVNNEYLTDIPIDQFLRGLDGLEYKKNWEKGISEFKKSRELV